MASGWITGKRTITAALLLLAALVPFALGGERGAGKYCGVVVYDRWDACTLYSGVYVMYVSEKAKEQLREHSGKAIQIDAQEVHQPQNPGDGLISKLKYLSAAPLARNWVALEGLSVRCVAVSKDGEQPQIDIAVGNGGGKDITVFAGELAPTLLIKNSSTPSRFEPFDGPSFALVTRQSFLVGGETPRTSGRGIAGGREYSWRIDAAVPRTVVLKPGEEHRVRISFDLPRGEYDFLAGYGGGVHEGKCLASNLVAFNVGKNGKATWVNIRGREKANGKQ